MATRSNIIARRKDGKWQNIYCHWDGYPSGVGQALLFHYTDEEEIEKLLALGALSSLGSNTGCPQGHSFNTPKPGYCVAYHRDRGEDHTINEGYLLKDIWPPDDTDIEYIYAWIGSNWLVTTPEKGMGGLELVSNVLAKLSKEGV